MIEAGAGSAPPDWPKAGDAAGVQTFGPFSHEELARYAAVSGDDNPLHLDPEAARAAGLAGPLVHGMLMLSCFEPLIMRWRRDVFIARLSAKFLRPVFAGEGIRVLGRVLRSQGFPRPELILRLTARGPSDDLVILAEAAVLYKNSDPLG
ncbi:MAG: MaoC family dehydratase [Beijerinckiaceae bacterium]|nr:MaoC family dehydratase [Beijerinckiaceae bacterium]